MRRRVAAIALVAPLLGVAADAPAADTAIPAEAQAWLSSGSDARVENDAWGDLSGHGTRDWAGLVDVTMPNDEERYHLRVVVFMQRPDGRYRLAVQSATQREDCGTSDCQLDDMRIAKQSLFVGWRARWHGCNDAVTFQFRARDGHWPLIGVVTRSTEDPWGTDENDQPLSGRSLSVTIDHNRLTGDAIVTRRTDTGAARVSRFKLIKPVEDLENFDSFTVPVDKEIPGLCGRG